MSGAPGTMEEAGIPARFAAVLAGLAVAQTALLAATLWEGASGPGTPPDFVLVWAAGIAARAGEAASFYDPAIAKLGEVAAAGRDFDGVYRWVYPPVLFLLAAPLSLLPLAAAQAAFTTLSFAGFAALLARIAGPAALLLAAAWPASLACAVVGQNGFLTAGLLGAGALAARRHPALAGCLFGCLILKPHLALLVPVALVAGGGWRAAAWTGAAGCALSALAALAFGLAPWLAFLHWLPQTGDGLLGQGVMGFGKLQTVYGAARAAGVPALVAAALQAACACAGIGLTWRAWRGPDGTDPIRAAALAAGTLLVSPYLYAYDLPVLAVSAAILLRAGSDRTEIAGLGFAVAALLAVPFTGAPTGVGATLAVAALVARRAFPPAAPAAEWRPDPIR